MRIALGLGLASETDVARLDRLIGAYWLPATVEVDPDVALRLMVSDKKRVAGSQRRVLPQSGGGVRIYDGVAEQTVREALEAVRTSDAMRTLPIAH